MIKINLNILMSALIIAPKKDVRYYLNGIHVSINSVTATDGSRLFCYDIVDTFLEGGINQDSEKFESFIIPRESIVQINKSLTAQERKDAVIFITQVDDIHYRLTFGNSMVLFVPIDGKYPDIARVIPKDYKPGVHGSYDWSFMFDFQKISKLLGSKYGIAKLLPNDNNSALVTLPDSNATCVIMPMRE